MVGLPQHGKLTNATSNTVTYTSNATFSGTDSFTYKATDGQGVSSTIATVTITVNAQQNLPTADNINTQTNAGTPKQITLTGTDPIQGDVLKFSVVGLPQHGKLTNATSNTVTYTSNATFSGTDSFTYKATDGQGVSSTIATVTITVNAQQNLPTADNINTQTNAGTPKQITLTGTDPIQGDVLKFSVVGLPQHGKLTNATSNTVTYTSNATFSGTDSFTYKATNGLGVDSTIATVTITVKTPPPPAPTVDNMNIKTNKGTPIQIPLIGHDPIQGDMLKFSVLTPPHNGAVTNGTVSSNVFYTPNPGFIGADSFTYKATDGLGVDSNIATVTIIVSNATSGAMDQFGVKELNPSKPGGEQWFFNGASGNPNNDPRTGTPNEGPHTTFTGKNPDGSWKVQSSRSTLRHIDFNFLPGESNKDS